MHLSLSLPKEVVALRFPEQLSEQEFQEFCSLNAELQIERARWNHNSYDARKFNFWRLRK